MKTLFLTIIILCFTLSAKTQIQIFKGTLKDAFEKAKTEDKNILIMISATWCGPCQSTAKNILPLEEVGKYVNKRYIFMHCETNIADPDSLVSTYKIDGYPSFLFLDEHGKELAQSGGGYNKGEGFIAMLKNALQIPHIELRCQYEKEPEKFADEYLIYLHHKKDFQRVQEVFEQLFQRMSYPQFYTRYFHFIESLPLQHKITMHMLDHKNDLIDLFGKTFYSKKIKNCSLREAVEIFTEKNMTYQHERFRQYQILSEQHTELGNTIPSFMKTHWKEIEEQDLTSLLAKFSQTMKTYNFSEKKEILYFLYQVACNIDFSQYKQSLLELAQKLDLSVRDKSLSLYHELENAENQVKYKF